MARSDHVGIVGRKKILLCPRACALVHPKAPLKYPGEPSVPRPPLTSLMLLTPLWPPQLVRYDNFYARTRVYPGVGTTSSPLLLRRACCPVAILSSDTRHSIPQSGMDRCTESACPPPRLRAHADRMAPSSLLLKLIYIKKTSTIKRSSALARTRSRFAWAAAQPMIFISILLCELLVDRTLLTHPNASKPYFVQTLPSTALCPASAIPCINFTTL